MDINKKYKKNDFCRYCYSKNLLKYLSLGKHPPSNSFIKIEDISNEDSFPLEVYFCKDCFLSQLLDVVQPEIIFDDYAYLSSSSQMLCKHFENLVQTLVRSFDLKRGETVVDIGCNDGIILKNYNQKENNVVGVEPSLVSEVAKSKGFNVFKEFFGDSTAKKIVSEFGKAKFITATNVFVHVDDMHDFVTGCRELIADDGVLLIESSYLLDVIDMTLFDTIYHEHLCYLSLNPLVKFLDKFELTVFNFERQSIGASGPAARIFIQKKDGKYNINSNVKKALSTEKQWGIGELEKYLNYANKVNILKNKFNSIIHKKKKEGFEIGAFGASAKGNTLLNYFKITKNEISYIAENNPKKIGLFTPGSHIPIVSDYDFLQKMPEYAVLLSWNYLDFFLSNSPYIKKGGKFIVPLPDVTIQPN